MYPEVLLMRRCSSWSLNKAINRISRWIKKLTQKWTASPLWYWSLQCFLTNDEGMITQREYLPLQRKPRKAISSNVTENDPFSSCDGLFESNVLQKRQRLATQKRLVFMSFVSQNNCPSS